MRAWGFTVEFAGVGLKLQLFGLKVKVVVLGEGCGGPGKIMLVLPFLPRKTEQACALQVLFQRELSPINPKLKS